MPKRKQKRYIFIDTNLYRSLFTSSEYEEKIFPILKKLVKDEYLILMPQQVLDEINRHIFSNWSSAKNLNKIKDLEKVIDELNKDFLSDFSYKQKLLNQIDKEIKRLKKQDEVLQKQLISPRGRSAKLIKKILNIVEIIPDTEEILKATQYRIIKGNPPFDNDINGKNCDRYIWESLLFYFRNQVIKKPFLYLFTRNTKDWCDKWKGERRFSQFLLYEFKNKTKGKILWFKNFEDLPDISSNDKRIVKVEEQKIEKEDIIYKIEKTLPNQLLTSNTWGNTDKIMRQVINYIPEFTSSLISQILDVSIRNNEYSIGPFNQVLGSSQAKRFFIILYERSKEIGFPLIEWKKFYLQLSRGQQEEFYDIRKNIEDDGLKFNFTELKFLHSSDIPF